MSRPFGLYRLYDREGLLLFIGASAKPEKAWAALARSADWWPRCHSHRVDWFPIRRIAMKERAEAVSRERPVFNSAGKSAGSPDSSKAVTIPPLR